MSSKGNNGALLNVLEIPKDSTAENRKLNLYGEVKVDGNFYVNGSLSVGTSVGTIVALAPVATGLAHATQVSTGT